jgi:uncharacterized membrane protein
MEKTTNRQQADYPEHPPEKGQVVKIERQISQFSGPLPAPEILQRYETILPGSAERILAMAEMPCPPWRGYGHEGIGGANRH